jgi:predicted GIY-YIG superfamily endonuclease
MTIHYIYTITCKDINILDSYVGRTSNPIKRFRVHVSNSSKHIDTKLYSVINKYGGIHNWDFNIIESFETHDSNLYKERELFYYNLFKPTLNTNEPNRDIKQWRIDHKNHYNKYMKDYMNRRNLFLKQLQYFNLF